MKALAKLALAASLAASLGACQELEKVREFVSAASAVTVPRSVVVLALDGFYAVENTGTAYLRAYVKFPGRCDGARFTQPLCRDPAVHRTVDGAIFAGRAAATKIREYLRANPTADGLKADYDSLNAAKDAIEQATAAWRAAKQ